MKISLYLALLFLSQTLSAQGKFFGGNGDGFATATITNVILPVNILDFTVYKNGQTNKAELTLIYNEAICSLQLQRSSDGNRFSIIDSIRPVYSAGSSNRFAFIDPAPANGINYYRVQINRCDASYLFSNTVSVKTGSANNHLYYSPVDNTIHYAIVENGLLKLGNVFGQIIYKKIIMSGAGVLSLPPLSSGIYFIQFAREAPVKILVNQ